MITTVRGVGRVCVTASSRTSCTWRTRPVTLFELLKKHQLYRAVGASEPVRRACHAGFNRSPGKHAIQGIEELPRLGLPVSDFGTNSFLNIFSVWKTVLHLGVPGVGQPGFKPQVGGLSTPTFCHSGRAPTRPVSCTIALHRRSFSEKITFLAISYCIVMIILISPTDTISDSQSISDTITA